jgi:hypothetical protein
MWPLPGRQPPQKPITKKRKTPAGRVMNRYGTKSKNGKTVPNCVPKTKK